MRLGGDQVGRWGAAVLAVAGIVGIALAFHGWGARGSGVGAAALPPNSATPAQTSPSAAGPTPGSATASAAPSASRPATGPSASASGATATPGATAAPLLKSEPYASYAFQIWPGPQTAAARQALTGLTVSVHKRGAALSVTAAVNGQGGATAHSYPQGAKVYVIEASLGDDSGGSDYNLGDDGLVVTDATGRVVQ